MVEVKLGPAAAAKRTVSYKNQAHSPSFTAAMAAGVILLGEVAARTDMLEVACNHCGRRARLATANLLKRYGRRYPMPDLRREVAHDCPNWQGERRYDLCLVYYPQLFALFMGSGLL
jgi:hypothetical protein